jgi:autotransporter-associated beta strand protein
MKLHHSFRCILSAAAIATIVFTLASPSAQAGWLPSTGTHDYLLPGNWDASTINGDFPATLTFTDAQDATFGTDYATAGALNFNYAGDFALTLRADDVANHLLTLSGNVTLNTTGGANANVTIGSSTDLQKLDINLGGTTRTFDIAAARTMTLSNGVSNGGITKNGSGTLTLLGTINYSTPTTLNAGDLILSSSSTSTLGDINVKAGGTLTESAATMTAKNITVGSSGGTSPAVMNFSGGLANTWNLKVGSDGTGDGGSFGGHVLNITSGTIDLGGNYLYVGGNSSNGGGGTGTLNISGETTVLQVKGVSASNHFDPGTGLGSVAYINQMGGTLNVHYSGWGTKGSVYGYQTGGVFSPGNPYLGVSGGGTVVYTLAGGTFDVGLTVIAQGATKGTLTILPGGIYNGSEIILGGGEANSRGVLNVAGTTVNATKSVNNNPTPGVSLGNYATTADGIINIADGQLGMKGGLSGSIGHAGTINLNNATLQYLTDAASISWTATWHTPYNPTRTWMGGFTHAFIFPGGLTVDSTTKTGGFTQALESATGSGVTSVTLTNGGGAGYRAQPIVSFTGGTLASGVGDLGVEAQAVAVWDQATGTVTGIVVTNPGQYSVAPTDVVISGGGASTTATASLTTDSNSGGGLTKTGSGSLTLSAAPSYSGNTTVSAGTLVLSGPNTSNETSTVTIAATGAKLKLNFVGTDTVGSLVIGTTPQETGVYGHTDSGADNGGLGVGAMDACFAAGTGTLTVSGGGYNSWAATNAGGEPADGDYDKDGVDNGVEYFMNASAGFTANPGLSGKAVTWNNGGNIDSTAYGTEFVVQTSPDLVNWTDVAVDNPNLSNTAGSLSYTLSGAGDSFVRLKVTTN